MAGQVVTTSECTCKSPHNHNSPHVHQIYRKCFFFFYNSIIIFWSKVEMFIFNFVMQNPFFLKITFPYMQIICIYIELRYINLYIISKIILITVICVMVRFEYSYDWFDHIPGHCRFAVNCSNSPTALGCWMTMFSKKMYVNNIILICIV